MAARPFRVLMTADTVGGVWTYAIELCRALSARGDRVLLATMGGAPDAGQQAEADAIPGLELAASDFRLMWMRDPWDDVEAAGAWLLALSRRFVPDLVHLNDYAHVDLPWRVPTLVVGHSCVWSWWHAVKGTAPPPEWQRYRRRVGAGLAAADLVIAPTAGMLAELRRHYGPLAHAAVVPNGRHAHADAAPEESVVFGAGRLWDEAKNLAMLAKIAPQLAWPVEIAGDCAHPDGGEATGFEHVRLLGRLPEATMRACFARAAIYVLPARYEPFGLSALEAAQAGCALVLGDIPTLREVWGAAALYADPDDADALLAQIQRLIEDSQLRSRQAIAARRRAARYSASAMADAYCAVYTRLRAANDARYFRAQEIRQ